MYFVYLLQHTETKEKYIGSTSNLKRRLAEHNNGQQISTRRMKGEWKVIYAEIFRVKSDACARELKLKQNARGRQELYKRIQASFL